MDQLDQRAARLRVLFAHPVAAPLALGLALGSAMLPGAAAAAGTPAGTDIQNVASASYDGPGGPVTLKSNPVVIKVDELIDLLVVSADPGDVAASAAAPGVLSFTITNSGNGSEAFALAADVARAGDDFDPALQRIVIDSNGNGQYDPGIDTAYAPGSNDPLLQPDSKITVFVLATMPAGQADASRGKAALTATAKTGSGAPGTVIAGQGQGGGDAVIGLTGARALAEGAYRISSATVTLTKSASVTDPFGGSRLLPGSLITYSITATVAGSGSVGNLVVRDAVPPGTVYQPGSLALGGLALTDASDADAGAFDGAAVSVALGTVAGGQSRVVAFKVKVQ